jgi:hypothetical protein
VDTSFPNSQQFAERWSIGTPNFHLEAGQMVVVHPNLRSIANQDGAVILDIPSNQVTTLNATGAYIWVRLQDGKAIDQIIADLARETGHDPTLIANDIYDFIKQMAETHLLHL